MTNFRKLSSYTKLQNCSDLYDCNQGIKELRKYFDDCYAADIKPASTAYSRYSKLIDKRNKFELKAIKQQFK